MRPLSVFVLSLFHTGVFTHCSAEDEGDEKFAPLPQVVDAPTFGRSGWSLESFGSGAYMVSDGLYQSMFLVSTHGVIVVDAPPTIGVYLGYAIGNVTDKPITHFIYSHVHADHVGAAFLYTSSKHKYHHRSTVEIIGHQDTKYLLEEVNDPKRPVPTITFKRHKTLRIGNQTVELSYKGENHLRGNIFIWAPASKALMVVDLVYPGWVPFTDLAESTNIPGWIKAHEQILAYDFKHYVGGHLGRSGTRKDVEVQKEYVRDLFANCKAVIEEGVTDDPTLGIAAITGSVLKNNPGNLWAEFLVYQDVTAEACANKTNEKWLSRLGGADVFGASYAGTMLESLRLDYNILGPFENE